MTVYLLFEHWEYEDSEVVAVYSTEAAAKAEAERRMPDDEEASYKRLHYYVKPFVVEGEGYTSRLLAALRDLVNRADTTELHDGSSLDTAFAHAVLEEGEV